MGNDSLPVTEHLADTLLAVPTGAGVTTEDIAVIGSILRTAYETAPEVQRVLGTTRSLKKVA